MRKLLLNSFYLLLSATVLIACDVHQFPEPVIQNPDNPDDPSLPQDPDDPGKNPPKDPDDPNNPNNPDNPDDPEPEVPDTPPDYPDDPDEAVSVPISLIYDTDFYLWEHNYDPLVGRIEQKDPSLNIYPGHPGVSDKYDNLRSEGVIVTHAKVYLTTYRSYFVDELNVTRAIDGAYDNDLELKLYPGYTYQIGVWSHLLEDEDAGDFYNYSNFNKISIVSDNYKANTDYRDAYSGSVNIEVKEGDNGKYTVNMTRPMGKFELVTTDLSEFLERETRRRSLPRRAMPEEYRVIITFPMYYPSSYSLMDDRLENSVSGVRFETRMTVTGESEASLGFEYVLLNDNDDAAVQAKVDIYDMQGMHVAGSATLTIPMKRDHHTLLRGAFLREIGEGGVGIDPGFFGDHNVIW